VPPDFELRQTPSELRQTPSRKVTFALSERDETRRLNTWSDYRDIDGFIYASRSHIKDNVQLPQLVDGLTLEAPYSHSARYRPVDEIQSHLPAEIDNVLSPMRQGDLRPYQSISETEPLAAARILALPEGVEAAKIFFLNALVHSDYTRLKSLGKVPAIVDCLGQSEQVRAAAMIGAQQAISKGHNSTFDALLATNIFDAAERQSLKDYIGEKLETHLSRGEFEEAASTAGFNQLSEIEMDVARFRDAAKRGVLSSLERTDASNANSICATGLIDRTFLNSPEVKAAALTGLMEALSTGRGQLRKLVDSQFLDKRELETPIVREAIRSRLETELKEGGYHYDVLMDIGSFSRSELDAMKPAARQGLLSELAQTHLVSGAQRILETKILSPEDLNADDLKIAAKGNFTNRIVDPYHHSASEFLQAGLVDLNDFEPGELNRLVTPVLMTAIERGQWSKIQDTMKCGIYSTEELNASGIKQALSDKLTERMLSDDFRSAWEAIGCGVLNKSELSLSFEHALLTSFKDDNLSLARKIVEAAKDPKVGVDLQTDTISAEVRTMILDRLARGEFRGVGEIERLRILPKTELHADDMRYARVKGVVKNINQFQKEDLEEINYAKQTGELTREILDQYDVQTALVERLEVELVKPDLGESYLLGKLLGDEKLAVEPIHSKLLALFEKNLSAGDAHNADILSGLVDDKTLKSPDVKLWAESGIKAACLSDSGDKFVKVAKTIFSADELESAAVDALKEHLADGNYIASYRAERLIDKEHLKQLDLHAEAAIGWNKALALGVTPFALLHSASFSHWLRSEDRVTSESKESAAVGLKKALNEDQSIGIIADMQLAKLVTREQLRSNEYSDILFNKLVRALSSEYDVALKLVEADLLSHPKRDEAFKEAATRGHVSSVIRAAMTSGIRFNAAMRDYFGISKLTPEAAEALYETMKQSDQQFKNADVQKAFEDGAAIFGADRMLRYALRPADTPHDALMNFGHILTLQKKSGLTVDDFHKNILAQVTNDNGQYRLQSMAFHNYGYYTSYSELATIAANFPDDPQQIFSAAAKYPDLQTLQELVSSFSDKQQIFSSWQELKKFGKLRDFVDSQDLFAELQQLHKSEDAKDRKLGAWLETLAFHRDSKIAKEVIMQIWKEPGQFFARPDTTSLEVHNQLAPSNYTQIEHLDLSATQLRDALIDGTLDKLQVFTPTKIEYQFGFDKASLGKEITEALGSNSESVKGDAKIPGKLYDRLNRLFKTANLTVADVVAGADVSDEIYETASQLLYDKHFGRAKPNQNFQLVAEIHRKSDPFAVLAGDDTATCMPFGNGKTNNYMINPNVALFTVRLVRPDGSRRTIAQSVLTKDQVTAQSFDELKKELMKEGTITLPADFSKQGKAVLAADNVEVHPAFTTDVYQSALSAVYSDFFHKYLKENAASSGLNPDLAVVGMQHSDALAHLGKTDNKFIPQTPISYTDKYGAKVYEIPLNNEPLVHFKASEPIVDKPVDSPRDSTLGLPGLHSLTFEDALLVAHKEGDVYDDNRAMQLGLFGISNELIATDINNAAKNRPNMSLKMMGKDGEIKGYLLAYEGKMQIDGEDKPIVYLQDYASNSRSKTEKFQALDLVGGSLLMEFMRNYKKNYIDQGKMIPIYARARDVTSYQLLTGQFDKLARKKGYSVEIKELGTSSAGANTMHEVLIVPRRIDDLPLAATGT
jgi:enoyl-CoA hydratase/carnithine racemase